MTRPTNPTVRCPHPPSHCGRAESLKIYPAFSLSAVTLNAFLAEVGSDDDSVVGYPKMFHPSGAGVAEGDRVKWVVAAVTTDAGCELDGVVDESMVAWTTSSTMVESLTVNSTTATSSTRSTAVTSNMGEELVLAAFFTFTTPTLNSARVQLCYKHQLEPYHLHPSITLRTRQLVSATIRELGTEQTLMSITNSPQAVAFVAHGGMEGDRYKWVQTTGSTSSEAMFDSCAEWVDPAAGSSIGVATGFYQEALFTFSESASNLMLCYGPGSELFAPYPEVTMQVITPIVSAASVTHVLVGRDTTVRLVGTFGLTSGDAMKLAENADRDCEGDPAGGDATVFYPDGTNTGLTGPALGTSDITLYVSERTQENQPFKLCYRFGAAGSWELFDNISWEAYEVTVVSVHNGDGSPAAGQLLDFTFSGTGIVDGGDTKSIPARGIRQYYIMTIVAAEVGRTKSCVATMCHKRRQSVFRTGRYDDKPWRWI